MYIDNHLISECSPNVHPITMEALVKTESGFNPFAMVLIKGQKDFQIDSYESWLSFLSQLQTLKDIKFIILIPELKKKIPFNELSLFNKSYPRLVTIQWNGQSFFPNNRFVAENLISSFNLLSANFSIGLGQINKANFKKYNLNASELLDACKNLSISEKILQNCYVQSPNKNVSQALSCYYSGNWQRGFQKDYKNNTSYVERVSKNALKTSNNSNVYVPNILNASMPLSIIDKKKSKSSLKLIKNYKQVTPVVYKTNDLPLLIITN